MFIELNTNELVEYSGGNEVVDGFKKPCRKCK